MLVISRKTDQEVVLVTPEGHEITVGIVEIRGQQVRLGLIADKEVSIHRRELFEAIHKRAPKHTSVCCRWK